MIIIACLSELAREKAGWLAYVFHSKQFFIWCSLVFFITCEAKGELRVSAWNEGAHCLQVYLKAWELMCVWTLNVAWMFIRVRLHVCDCCYSFNLHNTSIWDFFGLFLILFMFFTVPLKVITWMSFNLFIHLKCTSYNPSKVYFLKFPLLHVAYSVNVFMNWHSFHWVIEATCCRAWRGLILWSNYNGSLLPAECILTTLQHGHWVTCEFGTLLPSSVYFSVLASLSPPNFIFIFLWGEGYWGGHISLLSSHVH